MLSSQFLINQKQCANGCRMCPCEPQHLHGNKQLQKMESIQKKSYTTHMNK